MGARNPDLVLRARLIGLIIVVLTIAGTSEAFFSIVDPWGAYSHYRTIAALQALYIPHSERPYVLPAGQYQFHDWSATVLDDYTRAVPATNPDGCTLVVLGDSVAFGWSVNDDETLANRIAEARPGLHVINAAIPAYSIRGVAMTRKSVPGEHYVYLLFSNDAGIAGEIGHLSERADWLLASRVYLEIFLRTPPVSAAESGITSEYWEWLDILASDPDVTIFYFGGDYLSEKSRQRYPALIPIPMYSESISRNDPHPSARSIQRIADAMIPHLACP